MDSYEDNLIKGINTQDKVVKNEKTINEFKAFLKLNNSVYNTFSGVKNEIDSILNNIITVDEAEYYHKLFPTFFEHLKNIKADLSFFPDYTFVPEYQKLIDKHYTFIMRDMTLAEAETSRNKMLQLLAENKNHLPNYFRNLEIEKQRVIQEKERLRIEEENRNRIAEQQRLQQEAEKNRLAEIERQRIAQENERKRIEEENRKRIEEEKIKSNELERSIKNYISNRQIDEIILKTNEIRLNSNNSVFFMNIYKSILAFNTINNALIGFFKSSKQELSSWQNTAISKEYIFRGNGNEMIYCVDSYEYQGNGIYNLKLVQIFYEMNNYSIFDSIISIDDFIKYNRKKGNTISQYLNIFSISNPSFLDHSIRCNNIILYGYHAFSFGSLNQDFNNLNHIK